MSVVKESPEIAYVKGGLFAKTGAPLPKPAAETFWGSREEWEVAVEGGKLVV
jgi:hypothetical protein